MWLSRRQSEDALGIAVADLLLVGGRQTKRLDDLDGVADVARPLLLVERTIGCEQHVVGREEVGPAHGGGARTFDRGVAVKTLEIVVRPFFKPLEDGAVVLV